MEILLVEHLFTVKPDKNSASCFISLLLFYFTENYAFYGRFFEPRITLFFLPPPSFLMNFWQTAQGRHVSK